MQLMIILFASITNTSAVCKGSVAATLTAALDALACAVIHCIRTTCKGRFRNRSFSSMTF